MNQLYEILIPADFDLHHHRKWDDFVRKLSGGLTILRKVKGQWLFGNSLYEEKIIPVRVSCTREQLDQIIDFTIDHYKQEAVMAYLISSDVIIRGKQ